MNSDNATGALAVIGGSAIVTQIGPTGLVVSAVGAPALVVAGATAAAICGVVWGYKALKDS